MAVQRANDIEFTEILSKNQKVIVKYSATWCGNCRLLAPKFKRVSNEEDMKEVVFIDIDAEENPNARKMAGVDNLPYLAAFKGGALVDGSASSKEEYLRKLLGKLQ